MTTQALHQATADEAILRTLELIPTPSQPGQRQDDGDSDQPTHGFNGSRGNSEAKTAGPQLFLFTKMCPNAGGDALAVVDRTGGDALQACFN